MANEREAVERAGEHRIGRYLVRSTLGQGGMGKVLRAHDETLGRDVAIKVLLDGGVGAHKDRLVREAQALARLTHPNVVRVYDVSEVDGRLCMAMELVHGKPLNQWQRKPHPWSEVLGVYLQAGRGLAAAHTQGLVHRDFKPANCILDEEGTVKVLDFGLARGVEPDKELADSAVDADMVVEARPEVEAPFSGNNARTSQSMLSLALTQAGAMLGTLPYMAPEQLMRKPATPASDQFSFCVSLYEALYGKRPFSAATPMALLDLQLQLPIRRITRSGLPPVPKWVHDVLVRGLSVPHHQRFADMEALLAVLERGLSRRRRGRRAGLLGGLVIGIGGLLTLAEAQRAERPCTGLRDEPMPAWTARERQLVGEAIEGSGLPGAPLVRGHVEQRLDDYAAAWTEAHADACEDTWIRHAAGEQTLARRMACLDERRTYVRATVDELTHADARAAAYAVGALEELPPIEACSDVEALLRGPEPVPEEHAEQAAAVRELIARSWAIGATGNGERGMNAALRAVAAAEAIPEAPGLRLEALQNRGRLRRLMRQWIPAQRDYEAALELAEQLEDSARAIDVLGELIILAVAQRDFTGANAWLVSLRGKLVRFEDPRRIALRWRLEGLIADRSGRPDEALAATNRALELHQSFEPNADTAYVETLNLLGSIHRARGDIDQARATHEDALRLAKEGGHLPLVGYAHYDLGYLDYIQGRYEKARAHAEAALTTFTSFDRAGDVATLRPRLLLALVFRYEGEPDAAFEQAILAKQSMDERVPPMIRSELTGLLGSIHQYREEWDEAIACYREAREAGQNVPSPDPVDLAMLDSNIAHCLTGKGDFNAALALYDRVLAVLTIDAEPEDPRWAHPLYGRGDLLLRMERREEAVKSLREALEVRAALEQDPSLGADLRWMLGRTLGSTGEHSQEAIALVREARAAYASVGIDEEVTELDQWLADAGASTMGTPP